MVEDINLKDVWRVQNKSGKLIDPVLMFDLCQYGLIEVGDIVAMWKVKGCKTLIMLGQLTLIPKK